MKANHEQLIREIKRREQVEETLKERLKFETLLAELSARFVYLPTDRNQEELSAQDSLTDSLTGTDCLGEAAKTHS